MSNPNTAEIAISKAGPRANDATIARCRAEIESSLKRSIRSLILPLIKRKFRLASVGEGFQWGSPLFLPRDKVHVGRYSYIGAQCRGQGPLVIGDLCMISSHVKFVGNDHQTEEVGEPIRLAFAPPERPETILETDCWIGQGAIIREGVRIGRGAVVAAGSVVVKSVEPYSIVGGVPARHIRYRFTAEQIADHERKLFS